MEVNVELVISQYQAEVARLTHELFMTKAYLKELQNQAVKEDKPSETE
ncbi:hypothetical protein [Bacillus safensis]|nr:hypothetical protein [Bacillus safensis]